MICMAVYLWWRIKRSLIGVLHVIWGYIFLGAECIMAIGMIVGHSSRSFPVHREKVKYLPRLFIPLYTLGSCFEP